MKGKGKGKPFAKGQKKPKREAIMFDVKSRFEFLAGFSKRKAERRTKGNLINLKKELRRKKEESTLFKEKLNAEYQKTVEAVRHNYGTEHVASTQEESTPVIEERLEYFPLLDTDPFGDVSVQISALESPEFASMSRALPIVREPTDKPEDKPAPKKVEPAKKLVSKKARQGHKPFIKRDQIKKHKKEKRLGKPVKKKPKKKKIHS
jgi:hypothetical protein